MSASRGANYDLSAADHSPVCTIPDANLDVFDVAFDYAFHNNNLDCVLFMLVCLRCDESFEGF